MPADTRRPNRSHSHPVSTSPRRGGDIRGISPDGPPLTPPLTVAITSPYPSPTSDSPIPITVTFSRAVIDFTAEALTVVRGFISGFTEVLASVYNILITPTDNDVIVVSITNDVVHSAEGAGNVSAQFTIVFDSLRPHIALSPDPLPTTIGGSFSISANFTIAVVDFDASDISVQNGNISNLTMVGPGSGVNFTFTVSPISAGSVVLSIPQGVIYSAAGNSNVASNILSTNYSP